jgi:hypothetical protein
MKYLKTIFLSLSLCFIYSAAFSQTPDTTVMSVSIWYWNGSPNGSYVGPGGYGGGWGGYYNLSFDQTRTNMPPGDRMYLEMQTSGNQWCGSFEPWHKLTGYLYPVNWYNDTAGSAFKGSTNGTIHTSIDISPYFCSVATIYLRFVYVSATGGSIHASISNARYDLAPIHFLNPSVSFNGSPCDIPLTANFAFPVFCSKCSGGSGSATDTYVEADFGDGSDTAYIQFYGGSIYHTFYVNHTYNSSGTFQATFHIHNGYGGEYDTFRITTSKPPAAITANSTTFCEADSVILSTPYYSNRAYQWVKGGTDIPGATSSNYTASIGGVYKVTVTNTITGCSKTTVPGKVVTVNPLPGATITPQGPTTFCAGGSVILSANTGTGLTYRWKKDGATIPGATSENYTATTGGVYKVKENNSYGCSKLSTGVLVSVPCREEELNEISGGVSIFPNPASGKFTIQSLTGKISQITITNISGQTIFKKDFINPLHQEGSIEIDLANQAKGIYLIQVKTAKEVYNQKIIVE